MLKCTSITNTQFSGRYNYTSAVHPHQKHTTNTFSNRTYVIRNRTSSCKKRTVSWNWKTSGYKSTACHMNHRWGRSSPVRTDKWQHWKARTIYTWTLGTGQCRWSKQIRGSTFSIDMRRPEEHRWSCPSHHSDNSRSEHPESHFYRSGQCRIASCIPASSPFCPLGYNRGH